MGLLAFGLLLSTQGCQNDEDYDTARLGPAHTYEASLNLTVMYRPDAEEECSKPPLTEGTPACYQRPRGWRKAELIVPTHNHDVIGTFSIGPTLVTLRVPPFGTEFEARFIGAWSECGETLAEAFEPYMNTDKYSKNIRPLDAMYLCHEFAHYIKRTHD